MPMREVVCSNEKFEKKRKTTKSLFTKSRHPLAPPRAKLNIFQK
jgi:hypothetical protein